VIAVRNVNGTTEADAVSGSAKSGADDSTLPLTGVGITPSHNNCLVLHGLSGDAVAAASADAPWVNLFAGDAAANSLCVAYTQQKTAAAITAPTHWANIADDTRGFIIAIRDDGNGDYFDAYLPVTTSPALQVSPLTGTTGTVDKGTYRAAASIAITSVAGKTVTGVTVAATADSGINPFRGSMRNAGVSSTTGLNHVELPLTTPIDLTGGEGLLFGTFLHLAPRDYVDSGKAVQGGKYVLVGSASTDWKAWVVGGQFSKTDKADARNNYLIEVASSDTIYGSTGTANMTIADEFAFGSSGYYGQPSILWNELYRIGVFILAGGSGANPFGFDDIVYVINNGGGILPLVQQAGAGATFWCPVRFGGTDPIHIACNLNTFQMPRKADEIDYVDFHVSNNKIGYEFYGLSGDTLSFTNCVFTSPSSYYWRFNASHNSGSTIDFSGSSVINANVTLQATSDLSNVSFINCSTFTQNSATLIDCTFTGTKVTSSAPAATALISNSTFTSAGTGHAIEIGGTAADFTLNGVTFSGYSGTSTDAAIYVNIASGTVNISITGGGSTPSIRTAGATVNVINSIVLTLTGLQTGSDIVVLAAGTETERVNVDANAGTTYDYTYETPEDIDIGVFKAGYVPFYIRAYTLAASDGSVPVSQVADRNYLL
jgi:hypothetical protein